MRNRRVVVSLPNDNAYQHEQGVVAKSAAAQLGLDLELIHANDDAITQSQQLLRIIQSAPEDRPSAFIVEPVTAAGLKRVAVEAVGAGVGWVVSNNEVDYVNQLRSIGKAPVFIVTQGQFEIGRMQGRQIGALLPRGGSVMSIEGPSMSVVAKQRREGMESAKSPNLQVTSLRSKFSEEGARQSVQAWLTLATSRAEKFDLVAGQTHELALGAIKAFQMTDRAEQKKKWEEIPFLGIGVANQVKPLVHRKVLKAVVVTSATMHVALSLLARAIDAKASVPECTVVEVKSYPELEELQGKQENQELVSP